MNKFTTTLIFALLLAFSFNSNAQDWVAMMRDPNTNIHDVQKTFYKWYNEKHKNDKDSDRYSEGKEDKDDESYELFKRWEWFNLPRADTSGNRPDFNRVAEYADYLAHSSAHHPQPNNVPSPNTANWSYVGNTSVPTNSPDGSGFGGNGRVNRVRVFPWNNNIMFACASSGGLWKTTNGGGLWSTNTDQLGDLSTSDVAINPLKTNIMYLATGDGDGIQSIYPTPATIGVLKSYDGGNAWNTTSLSYTLTQAGANYYSVNEILIDPNDTSVILAATTFGIWRSANSGLTWTQASTAKWFHSMEFHPGNPNIVYAATSNVINGLGGSFYRSTNNGVSWTNITSGLPSNSVAEGMTLGVTAADTSLVYVLATRFNYYDYQGLYVSTNDGTSFTEQSGYPTLPNVLGRADNGNDYTVGQGWYDLTMEVSQTNKDSIWVGGINIWASSNGGVNWSLNADWFEQNAPFVHADIHHIQFLQGTNSKGYVVGCDGGVFVTYNSGTNWTNLSNNLANAQQYCIGASATNPGLWITGWQDNGTNASFSPWGQVYGGDGTDCFIDWSNPAIMYAETPGSPAFLRSTNSGTSWTDIDNGITDNGQWVTPWLEDPKTNTTLYCGINNIWKSTNSGSNWSQISTWGSAGHYISALVVDSTNVNYIYASYPNQIEYTSNGGTSWTNITGTLPVGSASITGIAVSAKKPSHIWVTFGGYSTNNEVFASTNFGATWTNVSNGLPILPVNTIVSESGSPNGIFVGTDQGVYYHDTVGNTWQFYNNNLPMIMVANLKIWQPIKPTAYFTASPIAVCTGSTVQFTDTTHNSPPEALLAATYGRGTWETPLYSAPALSWIWTFAGGNPATSNLQNPVVTYTAAGNYSVTLVVTNLAGSSTITKNSYITVFASPTVTTTINSNVNCNGGSNGKATANPSGGTSPYTYSWSSGGSTSVLSLLTAGTYIITLTDKHGCMATASASITQPTVLSAIPTVLTNVSCNGGDNGSASVTASGGTTAYHYSWTPAGGTNPMATGLSAGTYTISITDNNGCNVTASIAIVQAPPLNISIGSIVDVSCYGGNNGSTSFIVNGGTSPYTYSWNNNQIFVSAVSGLSAGTYTLIVKDVNGCSDTALIPVTQPNLLSVIAGVNSNINCFGNSNGIASSSVSGGTAAYTYSWSNNQFTPSISGLGVGTYTLNITDNNGCTASSSVTITQPLALNAMATVISNLSCYGNSTGSVSSAISGGTLPYTYAWTGGGTTASVSNLSVGTYILSLTDNNGCMASSSVTITQPVVLTAIANITSNIDCKGESSGSISSDISGGTIPYTYSWTGGGTNSTLSGLTAGAYSLQVTDNNGCTGTSGITITQPPALLLKEDSLPATAGNCNGSAWVKVSGGVGPYTYSWNNQNNSTTDTITKLCTGSYCCHVTDGNGCRDSVCVNIVTGIQNISYSSLIRVYPNPNHGEFTVQWSVISGQWSVQVYDILGQQVYSQLNIKDSKLNIDLSNKANGMYFIRVLNSQGVFLTQKKIEKAQ